MFPAMSNTEKSHICIKVYISCARVRVLWIHIYQRLWLFAKDDQDLTLFDYVIELLLFVSTVLTERPLEELDRIYILDV